MQNDEFLKAIREGDLAKVDRLLENSPSLAKSKDANGGSVILTALYSGQGEIARAIAAKKPELDIFEASSLGDLQRVKNLIRQNPSLVSEYSADGFTALALAAYLGQKESTEYLLEMGADVNAQAKNSTGFTALTGAVSQNHNEIAKILVKNGAYVNHRYEGGFTPLMHAAYAGNVDLVNFLLENGADPNVKMADGKSPLSFAREKGHDQIVQMLTKHASN